MTRQKSPVRLEWVDPDVCSMEYRLKIIGRLPFFKNLPDEAIAKINLLFHDRGVSADKRIYHEGDEAKYFYLVALGKVKLLRNSASGREVLLDILHGGEYFGTLMTLGGKFYNETAVAQTNGCILQISSEDFENILSEHPVVTRKVLEAVSRRLVTSQEIIKQLSTYTVEERIASALLRLAGKLGEEHGNDIVIQLPFSRQDLAAMTGTTVETVSRAISRFSEDGLVKSGRKWITLSNIKGLAELAK